MTTNDKCRGGCGKTRNDEDFQVLKGRGGKSYLARTCIQCKKVRSTDLVRKCKKCGVDKDIQHFAMTKGYRGWECGSCKGLRHGVWRTTAAGEKWEQTRSQKWYEKLRSQLFEHYGTSCACCGCSKRFFLTIDHIDGGGNRHRQEIKQNFYAWIRKTGFPTGFQVLCHNCQHGKRVFGQCPCGSSSDDDRPAPSFNDGTRPRRVKCS